MPTKKSTLIDPRSEIIASINKQLGEDTIIRGSQIHYEKHPRITSGSLALDVALGGGWTVNSWHEIYGEECLCPGTKILRTDLTWVNIESLAVGDEIIGFDENSGGRGQGTSSSYRRAYVTSLGTKMLPVYEIVTQYGRTYASEGHLWLTHRMSPRTAEGRRSEQRFWVRTDQLNIGNRIAAIGPPWETNNSWEAGYVAGFYDGEGCLGADAQGGRRVSCAQAIGPTADRILGYLEKLGYNPSVHPKKRPDKYPHWKEQVGWTFRGRYEDMRFLGSIRPERLLEKSSDLWENRSTRSVYQSQTRVLEVNYVGVRKVITIGTSTKTLIANGMLSHNSAGKTTVVGKSIAANQARDPDWTAFFVAAEGFNPEYFKMLGCDLDRIIVMDSNEMENCYGAVIEFLDSRTVDCIAIDSMPALEPSAEDQASMMDQQMGLAARINGKFFRKQNPALRRSMTTEERPVTCFMINQFRDKIGVMFGDPRTTPGGKAKNFYYYTRTELRRDEWITEIEEYDKGTDKKKKDTRKVGVTMAAVIKKNKTGPPERLAKFDFYFAANSFGVAPGDYDPVKDIIATSRYYGLIQIKPGGLYSYGDQQWRGLQALAEGIGEDLDLRAALTADVYSCVLKGQKPPDVTNGQEPQKTDKTRRFTK